MNILILANQARGYFNFFNQLANEFKKDNNKIFFAVDCEYSAYLNYLDANSENVYIFSKFLRDFDVDLKVTQKYQQINLNEAFLPEFDRAQEYERKINLSNEQLPVLKAALLQFFEIIIIKNSIDLVIYEDVSGVFPWFAWHVCNKLEVMYVGFTSSRLPGRFTITSGARLESSQLLKEFEKIKTQEIDTTTSSYLFVEEYLNNLKDIMPDYMKFNNLDKTNLMSQSDLSYKWRLWYGAIRYAFSDRGYTLELDNSLLMKYHIAKRAIKRKIKSKFINKYYSKPIEGESYILYPLHYHPEASTSVSAGSYLNEYEVIRNIAFNLPEGVILYIKDHLSSYAFPSLEFYKKIISLPNVRLISHQANTKGLIAKSKAIITLTSTVGYEALLMGKRVFLYGNVFYEFHRNVIRVDNPTRLFDLFQKWLNQPIEVDEEYNIKFVMAYYNLSLPGYFDISSPNAASLAKGVYPYLAKKVLVE